jgi:hypothetical protein
MGVYHVPNEIRTRDPSAQPKRHHWIRKPGIVQSKGRGKVKLSLCLTKHYAMKTYCGVDVQKDPRFLDLATGWG